MQADSGQSSDSAPPAVQSVFELHVVLHRGENERAEFFPLASSDRVAAESVRIVRSRVCWQICWHFSFFRSCQLEKLLYASSLKMAPAVGFEPTTNRLTADRSTTELRWIIQSEKCESYFRARSA